MQTKQNTVAQLVSFRMTKKEKVCKVHNFNFNIVVEKNANFVINGWRNIGYSGSQR